jgi:hypothetical protein
VRAIAPIQKEVPPELVTITDIAVRVRKPGFVPVEEWLLQGERLGFERSSPADHADANGRYSKTRHRPHEQSRATCHEFPPFHRGAWARSSPGNVRCLTRHQINLLGIETHHAALGPIGGYTTRTVGHRLKG